MNNLNMNNWQDAQADMRNGYGNGSVGAFTSGIVWITASLMTNYNSPEKGIWALIIGGMFIFPLSILISKLLGIKGSHDSNNPLGKLAMEGTIWMLMSMPLAYGLSLIKPELFFQGMLMIIAGRYLTFTSIYGMRMYWILGGLLSLAACALFKMEANAFVSALTGGLTEVIFGVVIYIQYKNKQSSQL